MTPRLLVILAALLGTLLWVPGSAAQEAQHFLMVTPGNEAATPDRAETFLNRMGRYLHDAVPALQDQPVRGWITNRRDSTQTYLSRDPVLAFVPPSVYLEFLHGLDRAATPVAEIPRFDATAQRYHLVAPNDGPSSLEALREALFQMPDHELGAELLNLMNSSGFAPVKNERLSEVARQYLSQ